MPAFGLFLAAIMASHGYYGDEACCLKRKALVGFAGRWGSWVLVVELDGEEKSLRLDQRATRP